MIQAYQAILNKHGSVKLLEKIRVKENKRALLIVFDEQYENSFYENYLPYILSEKSLGKDWNKPEEDEAWAYLKLKNFVIS